MTRRPARSGGLVAIALAICHSFLAGQDPDSIPAPPSPDSIPDPDAPGNCTLRWEPLAPDTRSVTVRETGDAHITYVSGRYLWTCGAATMQADSAVKRDLLRRVDLIGNVSYEDSIRTLRSGLLTYFEIPDLVVADRDVELVRVVDGSRLTGPHVEFLRAVTGINQQTLANGRPHMTFYPAGDEPREPFEVDADSAVFAGEDEARFFGDVVLARSDLQAEADTAYLTRSDEAGLMWGEPWVQAQEVRLSGDTIRFRSEQEELREVHALGDGFALGEQFEVRSDRIDIELEDQEIERVWAHGEGIAEALSGDHLLYGDSLRFALFASKIDTVFAVGDAIAIQGDSSAAASGLAGVAVPGAADPAPPDTIQAAADSTGLAVDSAAADTSRALPDALALAPDSTLALPDSIPTASDPAVSPTDTAGAAVDTLATPGEVEPEAPGLMERVLESAQQAAGEEPSMDPADSTAAPRQSAPSPRVGPRLPIDGTTNWVRGDTLIAIFERPGRIATTDSSGQAAAGDSAAVDSSVAAGDSAAVDSSAVSGEGADAVPAAPPAAADSAADPVMERLIVIGNARALYRQVRDTSATERPSRNYMIATRIDIRFRDGEPRTVSGKNAIGIYLEPDEAVPTSRPGAEAEGALVPPIGDSIAAGRDTLALPPDTLALPPDTLALPPDTLALPPDSTGAPPDTVAAPRTAWQRPPPRVFDPGAPASLSRRGVGPGEGRRSERDPEPSRPAQAQRSRRIR